MTTEENTTSTDETVQENSAAVQETLDAVKDSLKLALQNAIQQAVAETQPEIRQAIEQAVENAEEELGVEVQDQMGEGGLDFRRQEPRPHAFVVMPFGRKKAADGSPYDFNAIYQQVIKPSLEAAGFESFRADEETVSGDILTDMFQELLLADLVICDLSIDNANVFYEVGIRHAFRKRGVVHIQAGRAYMPFDIFNVRTIPYHVNAEGLPDPAYLEKDRQAITRVARDTWASDIDAVHSPIFNLLTGLVEPERKTLRTPLATGFWREYNDWKQRVTVAQRQKRIGDILVLTEEISNPLIKEEAVAEAGKALQNMGRNELALQQYRKGLEINPRNLNFRRQEALFLNRLGRVDEAIVKLENLLAEWPRDTEAIGSLGRIYKDMWNNSWKWVADPEKRLKTAFDAYHWLIKAIQTYMKGYYYDMNNTYPGVNALTLATILIDLADKFDDKDDPDPEIEGIRALLPELHGALVFALEEKAHDEQTDYWTLVSLAELRVMTGDRTQQVTRAYRKSLTAARGNQFYLESSLKQLEMLSMLSMRPEFVRAGVNAIESEIRRINKKEEDAALKDQKAAQGMVLPVAASNVLVFTGYMVDSDDRPTKRFPPMREADVREAILKTLEKLGAGPEDVAFVGGVSAGSELLFVECCIEKGLQVEVHLPFPEAQYIRKYISPAGDTWVERFYNLRNNPQVNLRLQNEHIGAAAGKNIYARNNRWALSSSFLWGIDKVRLIAFWDGKGESPLDLDGQIVKNMVDQVRELGVIMEHINSTAFNHIPDMVASEGYGLLKVHPEGGEGKKRR